MMHNFMFRVFVIVALSFFSLNMFLNKKIYFKNKNKNNHMLMKNKAKTPRG